MIILAVDSGVERTGYAVFDKQKNDGKLLTSGLITTSRSKTASARLRDIYTTLSKLIASYKPEKIIIERLFFFKNQKTVIAVAQAQGAVLLLASQKNILIEFLTPLEIKQTITGYGQADKKSIQKMLKMTLHLNGELKQDDEADAIACGLAYCYLNTDLRR